LMYGNLWTWGDDSAGQLGNYVPPGYSRYLSTAVDGPGRDFIATAGGALHDLVLTGNGQVWAWGDNTKGQQGSGSITPADFISFVTQVKQLHVVSGIAAGRNTSYAIIP
jgi:alpha-tubulin suppressor-like RCC1 family protein